MDTHQFLTQGEPTPDYELDTERIAPIVSEPKPRMVTMVSPSGQRIPVQVGSLVHRLMKDQGYKVGGAI